MAQLFFRYGAMNSGKTIEILKVAHNYEEQHKKVLILTSSVDDRDGIGYVSSRIGMKREAIAVGANTDIYELVNALDEKIYCVLFDESQFVTKQHVEQMARVVDELKIPVMCFGLKNDSRNELFEGSKYLLVYADKIEEIKTICWFCEKKAIMNLRINADGTPNYGGEQIHIAGNESYYPVCRRCYKNPKL
ncbi:thymidine kinase [Brochothrix thermosphacta]|uniref:thymidine kinase n=1 Tax=Brochothrix thermosphacta TaxID=2756 RepID=UPI00083F98E6|nr:thymidine kinase [Brochothrix thermosphacta]MDO7864755.1 thymidine kinase [Brochothrix thermosphacta]ODJ64081.1 thymidine kinase [Brochothrix thermosphacta]ODJ67351.1 thymidine kinase [Brochothrix thermosphacta]SOC24625.1 Thymidine kinase [Brochothrix thermosphacta]SPN70771.1 Thymidine kinase [Brochothrix thermosphacta]